MLSMQVRLCDPLLRSLFKPMYGYEVYSIEATVHAPSWEGVYGEALKVLKPGGVVSSGLWNGTRV
jgi:hypothetical protein